MYRYHMLEGAIAQRDRELARQTCERFEIHIKRGVVSKDHVHLLEEHQMFLHLLSYPSL